ncbi:MAG: type-F conjugative transfer system protein TraW [Rhodospirillaceae bacterium]|nr:type-F conjugative transfer system protein TraW [Rhodospirillaceae bacterium]MYI48277.1 type-F conjugative transfer system protein TraW [Rhodospirillaceae bacterium]
MKCARAMLLVASLGVAPVAGHARDLGVRGATWPVAEPDLLAQIEARLVEMERTGELARLQRQARERARIKLEEPDAVPGIAPATEERSRLFDPSITVARDIRTPDGTLIAAAGTRVNPLERTVLVRDLLFVDGRREAEVAWALAHDRPSKIVLLAGRPLDLMRRHRRPFFFDTGGRLAARFGLRLTPVLVAQVGTQLRIAEIPVEDRPAPDTDTGEAPGSGSGLPRTPIRGTSDAQEGRADGPFDRR